MLILTRKFNQKIMIGETITVTVLSVNRTQVKIGIDAPDDVKILRGELTPWVPKASGLKIPMSNFKDDTH